MNPSYFRIKTSKEKAIQRFLDWMDEPVKEKYDKVCLSDCVKLCLDENEQWKGTCLYIYEKADWTIFEDVSGFLSTIPAQSWKYFACEDEFIFAGYNDAVPYGEFIAIKNGCILKEFLQFPDERKTDDREYEIEMNSWIDVAFFVDEDELFFCEEGTVIII